MAKPRIRTKRVPIIHMGEDRRYHLRTILEQVATGERYSVLPAVFVQRTKAQEIVQEVFGNRVFGVRRKGLDIVLDFEGFTRAHLKAVSDTWREWAAEVVAEHGQIGRWGRTKPGRGYSDMRNITILSRVSKMNCRGFNLAAGPPELGGTCPSSSAGFMYLTQEDQQKAQRALLPGIPISEPDFVCNGCYALKNNYGNPNMVLLLAARTEATRRWLKAGMFTDILIKTIEHYRSLDRKRFDEHRAAGKIPHTNPNFFRIHDAGDFYNRDYAQAWRDIARAFPQITFWAPTRMWAFRKQSELIFHEPPPPNLTIRPSGMHFDGGAPEHTSRTIANALDRMRLAAGSQVEPHPPKSVWQCPAYDQPELGGGATPGKKGSGSCQKAHGPNSPWRGGDAPDEDPHHSGCRACWKYQDTIINYKPH